MDIERIKRAAREQGWRVESTTKGHPVFYPPDPGRSPIVGSGTAGDQASIRNLVAQMRRAGFQWPWTGKQRRATKKGR